MAIPYAIGSILGGAFAPTIAQALLQATGTTTAISWYVLVATLVGAAATLCLRDRRGIPLGPDHEAEQASGATIFAPNVAHREVVGSQ